MHVSEKFGEKNLKNSLLKEISKLFVEKFSNPMFSYTGTNVLLYVYDKMGEKLLSP
jgi:hypothetical protein